MIPVGPVFLGGISATTGTDHFLFFMIGCTCQHALSNKSFATSASFLNCFDCKGFTSCTLYCALASDIVLSITLPCVYYSVPSISTRKTNLFLDFSSLLL